jgi:hypothetical protein
MGAAFIVIGLAIVGGAGKCGERDATGIDADLPELQFSGG